MWWIVLMLGAQTVSGPTAAGTSIMEPCPDWATKEYSAEPSKGPATMVRLDCLSLSAPLPSPDGKRFLSFSAEGMEIVAADGGGPRSVFAVSGLGAARSSPQVQWSSNSDFLWGSEQKRVAPGGWFANPVKLFKYLANGRREELPSPQHAAGPLDDVKWIGGDGLALAQFGSLGSYYRPEREDTDPTLAIIDASSGRVLQALSMTAIPGARSAQGRPMIPLIRTIALAEGGQPLAFLQWPTGLALYWKLGEPPTPVAPVKLDFWHKLVLDPAGKWLLVAPTLSVASIAECSDDDPCSPEPPVTGPALELFDFATRERLWSISETTGSWGGPSQPIVSPDGRHVLMPVRTIEGGVCLLVGMDRGTVLQRIACKRSDEKIAFAPDGRSFTISAGGMMRTFAFDR